MGAPCSCPTCGQPVDPCAVLVSLDTNTVSHRGQEGHLQRQQAELLWAIVDAYPEAARYAALEIALWGAYGHSRPRDERNALRQQVSNIRRITAGMGLVIEATPRVGYRLEILPQEEADSRASTRSQAA